MRVMTLGVAAILAVGLSASALAAKKKSAATVDSFEKCEQLAIDRVVPHGQTGHTSFVQQCMGQPPVNKQPG